MEGIDRAFSTVSTWHTARRAHRQDCPLIFQAVQQQQQQQQQALDRMHSQYAINTCYSAIECSLVLITK